jgi:hypothetical protein
MVDDSVSHYKFEIGDYGYARIAANGDYSGVTSAKTDLTIQVLYEGNGTGINLSMSFGDDDEISKVPYHGELSLGLDWDHTKQLRDFISFLITLQPVGD